MADEVAWWSVTSSANYIPRPSGVRTSHVDIFAYEENGGPCVDSSSDEVSTIIFLNSENSTTIFYKIQIFVYK